MTALTMQSDRFVALDVHRTYAVVGAVNHRQETVLSPRRLAWDKLELWARQNLRRTDAVVLEATSNAWYYYDLLKPLVASVTVAHPLMVRLIAASRVRTDESSTLKLARLLAAGLIPAVWVPPQEVRELRTLVAHRQRLIRQRTQARNRLHSLLQRNNLFPPEGNPFAPNCRSWWEALSLGATEQLLARHNLTLLDALETLIAEVEKELLQLSTSPRWQAQVTTLVQLPGISAINALILLSAIGDIPRFPGPKQLVGYACLGASVYDSGQTHRAGRITKQGRREMRAALVEAAWVATSTNPYWAQRFEQLSYRLGKHKAIVAIARKLLVTIWHVLTAQCADRHADVEAIARKFMHWGDDCRKEGRRGLSRLDFVYFHLDQLGLASQSQTFTYANKRYHVPQPEPVAIAA